MEIKSRLKKLFESFEKEVMPFFGFQYVVSWLGGLASVFFLCFVPASVFTSLILCCSGIGLMLPFLYKFYHIFTNFDQFFDAMNNEKSVDQQIQITFLLIYSLLSFAMGVCVILWPFHLISRVYLIMMCAFGLIIPICLVGVLLVVASVCLIGVIGCGVFSLNPSSTRARELLLGSLLGCIVSGLFLLLFGMPIALLPAALFSLSPVAMIVIDLLCSFSIVGTLSYIALKLWVGPSNTIDKEPVLDRVIDSEDLENDKKTLLKQENKKGSENHEVKNQENNQNIAAGA